ncbi:MAG: SbcC/MukB-like Walker B domain-containing protein [Sedimenticola sp.]
MIELEKITDFDFQAGRYLHLQPRRVIHETPTTIQRAQRELRSAALKEDQEESHYRALVALLRDAVERKKTQGAKALLDPRYRLQFTVSVIEREGRRVVEVRTGSQGGSGGEKEIVASYILTASLSYALCSDGIGRPLFGTLVLDEAFSKSSQAVAARIIKALRQFGLHPLFITPNKEMRLLRSHTRSAILVYRRGPFASTTSLSWEELDRQARKRLDAG